MGKIADMCLDFDRVRIWLAGLVAEKKVSGVAAAVSVKGERVFTACEGFTDPCKNIRVSPHTVFRLASMTKPVTAAAVLLCNERGLLSLDDPVSRFFPSYRDMYVAERNGEGEYLRGQHASEITLRQLLTHSSGLGSGACGDAFYTSVKPHAGDTLCSAVERYAGCLLDFMPGTAQYYSAVLGFDVLAAVVERATGTGYGDFLKREIFDPLGMNRTSYLLSDFTPEELAVTCAYEGGELRAEPLLSAFEDFPPGYTGGGAGLLSTLDDYLLFAEELLRAKEGKGRVLSRASADEMSRPQLSKEIAGITDFFNWGLGVRALPASCEGQPLPAGSFGWSGAYGTHFWVDPRNGTAAVYMHNSRTFGGAGAPHTLAFERLVTEALGIN